MQKFLRKWNAFGRRHPLVLSFLQGLWMVLLAILAGVVGFIVGFGRIYGENYRANKFGVAVASLFLLLVLGLLMWHPWHQHKPASKTGIIVSHVPTTHKKGSWRAPSSGPVVIPNIPQPVMPLRAIANGKLSGLLCVLDPGHGGATPWGVDPGCQWQFQGEILYEAAYTYPLACEAADKVRALGAEVIFTAWSPTMEITADPQVAMPLPIAPQLPDGSFLQNEGVGLRQRADVAGWALREFYSQYKAIVFLSFHIDAMGAGWKGLHVCYSSDANSVPRMAELVGQAIQDGKYSRRHNGVIKSVVECRSLGVLRVSNNPLRQRILIETGIPGNDNDSWRLRNPASRSKMLDKVVIDSLKKYMAENPWEGGGQ